MAAPDPRSMIKVYGQLVKDPTDLTAAYPYGGTQLGMVGEVLFRPQNKSQVLTAEEWGDQVWEVVDVGTSFWLACVLRGIDDDAYAAVFLDTATGDPSGKKTIRFRVGDGRAGTLRSTKGMKLLFVPDAPLRHRALILRDALPVLAEDAEIHLSKDEEWKVRVVFHARPDSSDRVAEIGFLKDLAL